MKDNFATFIKKHVALILVLVLVPSAITALFALCYRSKLSVRDWMSFSGAALTYMGTVLVSTVALYQSEQANLLSKCAYELSLREYTSTFQIHGVEFRELTQPQILCDSDWTKNISSNFFFFEIDSDMEYCQCYKVGLKNNGLYPLVHMSISGSGYVERKHCKEYMEREDDTLVQPGETFYFLICNSFKTDNLSREDIFKISCENVYRISMTIELKIKRIRERDGSIAVGYSYKLVEDKTKM